MIEIKIKPMSVNKAWQGKRFKTPEYKAYEKICAFLLPKLKLPETGKLQIELIWGLSSKNSDWDNPIKPIQDIMQKKYGFNDNRIYKGIVEKVDVKKGEEFIKFSIKPLQ